MARSVAAGLNVVSSASRHTSALVTNEMAAGSVKARRAAAEGVPVVDEHTFLVLLGDVRPGVLHRKALPKPAAAGPETPAGDPTPAATGAPTPEMAAVPAPRQSAPAGPSVSGPLTGRRVLVLGGAHADAVAARTRVVELGGSAAVNLSRSVTDVILLPGGDSDRRMPRITDLGLPLHDKQWLDAPTAVADTAEDVTGEAEETATIRPKAPHVLPRGGVIDLTTLPSPTPLWHVTGTWAPQDQCEVDVVAFVLDEDEQVTFDEDFVFYGAPENPAGTVQMTATPGSGASALARATLDAATSERTLLLGEIYRRGPAWRFRAIGQGYDHGLADLARGYGVDITD